MRSISILLLLIANSLGCNPAEEARRRSAERNLRQLEAALRNYQERQAALDVDARRVIVRESEYYLDRPQQGRPADGTFPAGTEVEVVEDTGGYVFVRAENGIEGYVAAEAFQP